MMDFLTNWLLPFFGILIVSLCSFAMVAFTVWVVVGIVRKGRR